MMREKPAEEFYDEERYDYERDIVGRLRRQCNCNIESSPCSAEEECRDILEAANEIERLRAQQGQARRAVRWANYAVAELDSRNADTLAALRKLRAEIAWSKSQETFDAALSAADEALAKADGKIPEGAPPEQRENIMSGPDYIAQTGETRTREEREAWLRARFEEAKQEGCVHARATLSDDHGLLLLEAWKETPADEGPPRFSYAA